MEKENRLKVKISKLFQSSFNSCRPKNISDVADHPFFFPENRHHRQLIDLFSPKPQSFSSPPKWQNFHSRPKISGKTTLFPEADLAGRKPHSASPVSPLFHEKTSKRTKKKKTHYRRNRKSEDFTSITDNYYYDWYSSDEEDESDDGTTLFSSRSLSSDSSGSFRQYRARHLAQKKSKKSRGGGGCKDRKATDVLPLEGKAGKFVRDSFAVVKKSSDPHEDFRTSMVEMIVERQIFGAQELENLLQCFLSLNSEQHHRIIVEVFTEIWETLFSDCF